MKSIAGWLIKIFLVFTLAVLALLLILALVLWVGWPWWVSLFVALGMAGLLLAAVLLRKIWLRRREQRFVHQIIARDDARQANMAPAEQQQARELQARWKEAINALRHSHLRKHGNPLYVLPWYMVIGESGSGKTTAIQSARLSSPFAEMSRTSGISGTRNCDWWFSEQAVLIDTAGRYAMPVDEDQDKEEWQTFLTLLAKFRKKEPLNGLVVTVAADRLARADTDALTAEGRVIRQRIEELTRVLGARSPVYILVTKCDLVQGATTFCDQLPEPALQQAMGHINQSLETDAAALTDTTFRRVGERLRQLRLLMLHKTPKGSPSADLLLFPEELDKLRLPLTAFVQGAFQQNPYQETPLLRGIFFSSGRQEGTPFSHFLEALGLIHTRDVLPGTNKGLFLHDFFAKILPTDRHLFRPTQHLLQWRMLTRHLGLAAWVAVAVAACGLLSYAFVKNLNTLADVRREFDRPAAMQGRILADTITLDRFRDAVQEVESGNRNWWIPRLGMTESLKVEGALKQRFVDLFHKEFLGPFDQRMADRMTHFGPQTAALDLGTHVMHLARRINLIKACLDGAEPAQLAGLPQPRYGPALLQDAEAITEIQTRIGTQYLYSLNWTQDKDRLNDEMRRLHTWLKHLLSQPEADLNWLVVWAADDPDASPIGMADFWGPLAKDAPAPATISAAYTPIGKNRIETAIDEIESALLEPLLLAAPKQNFAEWYRNQYFAAWESFVKDFSGAPDLIQEKRRWQDVARRLPTRQGPYYALIQRISEAFQVYEQETAIPAWAGLAFDWQEVVKESQKGDVVDPQQSGLFRKATRQVTSRMRKAERALGVRVRAPMEAEAQLQAAQVYLEYQKALEAMVQAADSRNVAFDMATALFQQDPATGDVPFLTAHRALSNLKIIMAEQDDRNEAPFWHLLAGNILFMQRYVTQEAACRLQTLWENQVLLELQDVSADRDPGQVLMGPDGLATRFLSQPAAPFITRSLAKGYHATRALDMELAFEPAFLAYLSKGAQAARPVRSQYTVQIKGLPTGTNPEARVQPHATVLEMQCAAGTTRMENLNFPVAKQFNWSAGDCGEVRLRIFVGDTTLVKTYTGRYAFAQFLNDFKTGQRTFQANAFPEHEASLKRSGIEFIRVRYQLQGHGPVIQLLAGAPGRPPGRIATCWD
ncbi:type VI secretion protein IcmF/TssM N-terminal domain-containing protein [Desulfatitalea alkaliphila]|uniref:Type VI secretion system component TssM1 N-terminal domain-containing protein n=1 Tax=Desulfatitalea alkaliphila TaxID=2929485 RepID=A0AA41ULQ8_9BACT|nr:type VI secretion protein IcmF/TssM N-terminal domain-containing protein [Desulfatitalea alkaliphila]MCJ8501796.1 hypothetical protein [Desulfatitalea alkaliphila]